MAQDTFQPQLSLPQATRSASGSFRGVDLSGAAQVANNLGTTLEKRRVAAEGERDEQDVSEFIVSANEMFIQRDQTKVLQDDIIAQARTLHADGEISDDEMTGMMGTLRDIDKLKAAQKGISDPRIFNIRMRTLINNAVTSNPRLGGFFKGLFNDESLFADNTEKASSRANQQMTVALDDIHGAGNWGTTEVNNWAKQQVILQRTGQDLATLSANELASRTPFMVSNFTSDLTQKWENLARENGGFLKPEQMAVAREALSAKRVIAIRELNTQIRKRSDLKFNDGQVDLAFAPISGTAQESLRKGMIARFDSLAKDLDSKDFLEAMTTRNKIAQEAIKFNKPAILASAEEILGSGANGSSVENAINLLTNKTFMRLSESLGQDEVLRASGISAEELVMASVAAMSKNIVPQDPASQRREAAIAAVLTKEGDELPSLGASTNRALGEDKISVEDLANRPLPPSIAEFSSNVLDSLTALKDPQFSTNHVKNMEGNPEQQDAFRGMTTDWLKATLLASDESLVQQAMAGVSDDFVFDPNINRFRDIRRPVRAPGIAGAGRITAGVILFPDELSLLNGLLELSERRIFKGLVPSTQDITNSLQRVSDRVAGGQVKGLAAEEEEERIRQGKGLSFEQALGRQEAPSVGS